MSQTPTPTPTPGVERPQSLDNANSGFGDPSTQWPVDAAKKIYRPAETDKKARVLVKPRPSYPEVARVGCISGTVRLSAIFRSSGEVTNLRALNTLPYGLTDEAIKAARGIKFEPAVKGGIPVSTYMVIEYNFTIVVDEKDHSIKTPIVITAKPEAQYPDPARAHKTKGQVKLRLLLTPNGRIEIDKVIHGLPDGLTEAAIAAAQEIKFVPAVTKDGCVVGVLYQVEYDFKP